MPIPGNLTSGFTLIIALPLLSTRSTASSDHTLPLRPYLVMPFRPSTLTLPIIRSRLPFVQRLTHLSTLLYIPVKRCLRTSNTISNRPSSFSSLPIALSHSYQRSHRPALSFFPFLLLSFLWFLPLHAPALCSQSRSCLFPLFVPTVFALALSPSFLLPFHLVPHIFILSFPNDNSCSRRRRRRQPTSRIASRQARFPRLPPRCRPQLQPPKVYRGRVGRRLVARYLLSVALLRTNFH